MKKLSAIVLGLIASVSMMAQGTWTLTPKVGVTAATISGLGSYHYEGLAKFDPDYKIGFTGGAELGYRINQRWAVTGGLMYSMQGYDYDADVVGFKKEIGVTNHYINVPILANFYIVKGLAVKLGIQPGFLVAAKCDGEDVKDSFNTVDFSIPVGISYDFDCGLVLDARYNCGITNVYKDKYYNESNTNDVFSFTVGYKFKL